MQDCKLFDVYISYSHKDSRLVRSIVQELEGLGVRTYTIDSLESGEDYKTQIVEAIRSAQYFVPIITENSISSRFFEMECGLAAYQARDRAKTIIPVCFSAETLWKNSAIAYDLMMYQHIKAEGTSDDEMTRIATLIGSEVLARRSDKELLDRITAYAKAGAVGKAADTVCYLLDHYLSRLSFGTLGQARALLCKTVTLMENLYDLYDYDYGEECVSLARNKGYIVSRVEQLLENDQLFGGDDLLLLSVAIRLIYWGREIQWTIADAVTHGGKSCESISVDLDQDYAKRQKPYWSKYNRELIKQSINESVRYTSDELLFIHETSKYDCAAHPHLDSREAPAVKETKDDELLYSIASFMREGNRLFDLISEQECAEEFLKCLIVSYERLQKYCEVIGEKKVCAECVTRLLELKAQLTVNGARKATNEKAQDGIKSLLGVTIPKSGNFDVFISHKREDMDIASEMYDYLRGYMKEPFFDKYSLPEMSESEYRKSIMRALDGSRHFVVVLSQLSYLDSYWVRLEMEIFQAEIDEGRKPKSNFLMIVTGNVYDEIMASNKAVLPIEYRCCEIMRVDEYKTKLLSYLNK